MRTPAGSQQKLQHALQRDEQQLLLTPANTAWSRLQAHCMDKASCPMRQVPQTILLAACLIPDFLEDCVSPAVTITSAMSATGLLRRQDLQSHLPLHKSKAHKRRKKGPPPGHESMHILENTPRLPFLPRPVKT